MRRIILFLTIMSAPLAAKLGIANGRLLAGPDTCTAGRTAYTVTFRAAERDNARLLEVNVREQGWPNTSDASFYWRLDGGGAEAAKSEFARMLAAMQERRQGKIAEGWLAVLAYRLFGYTLDCDLGPLAVEGGKRWKAYIGTKGGKQFAVIRTVRLHSGEAVEYYDLPRSAVEKIAAAL